MRKLFLAFISIAMMLYSRVCDPEQISLPWWDDNVLGAPCTKTDMAEQGCGKIEIKRYPSWSKMHRTNTY